jgi:polyisoprenoid-binding protein YceI
MNKLIFSSIALMSLIYPASAELSTYEVDPAHSSVVFDVRHLVSQTEGRFREFVGTIKYDPKNVRDSSVEFTVQAKSIFTDNEKRDAHLKGEDFFAVDKYPTLSFKSKKVLPRGSSKLDVLGTLTIKGVSKEVMVPVTILGIGQGFQGEVAGFRSEFEINRKDFNVIWNRDLDKGGTALGDQVNVRLLVEAGKK